MRSIQLAGFQSGYQLNPSFSSDGRLLVVISSAGGNNSVEVFDVASGERRFECAGWDPQFLADGQTLMVVRRLEVQFWTRTTESCAARTVSTWAGTGTMAIRSRRGRWQWRANRWLSCSGIIPCPCRT